MLRIRTTTWRERNHHFLSKLKDEVQRRGYRNPVILDFGPGCEVEFLSKYMPRGPRRYWSLAQHVRRSVLKVAEIALRQTHCFKLITTEPEDLASLFQDLAPAGIHVFDNEKRVIQAVKAIAASNTLPTSLHARLLDLTQEAVPISGDIVIAYHVLSRTSDPDAALANLSHAVRVGGLLSLSGDRPLPDFERLSAGLYVRVRETRSSPFAPRK